MHYYFNVFSVPLKLFEFVVFYSVPTLEKLQLKEKAVKIESIKNTDMT